MEKDVNITYETLFELLRRERTREELQEMSETFFEDLVQYLQAKHKIYEESAEKEKIKVQLDNVHKIVKELYEKREKKLLLAALTRSRTGSDIVDKKRMLKAESVFYEEVTRVCDRYRKGVLVKLREMKMPEIEAACPPQQQAQSRTEIQSSTDTEPKKEELSQDAPPAEQPKTILIRFIQPVPKFVGKELEPYGPFEPDEIATLPTQIAEILVKKGRAVEIHND